MLKDLVWQKRIHISYELPSLYKDMQRPGLLREYLRFYNIKNKYTASKFKTPIFYSNLSMCRLRKVHKNIIIVYTIFPEFSDVGSFDRYCWVSFSFTFARVEANTPRINIIMLICSLVNFATMARFCRISE